MATGIGAHGGPPNKNTFELARNDAPSMITRSVTMAQCDKSTDPVATIVDVARAVASTQLRVQSDQVSLLIGRHSMSGTINQSCSATTEGKIPSLMRNMASSASGLSPVMKVERLEMIP